MEPYPIVIDPQIVSGTPVFRGTRVPVQTLFDYLEAGQPLSDFLEDFPTVPESLALQVLTLASEKVIPRNDQAA